MKRFSVFVSVLLVAAAFVSAEGSKDQTGSKAPARTLRLSIFDRGNAPAGTLENGPSAQWVQKAFGDTYNTKIEWVLIPRAKEVENLNLMMAAGDAPDLCFTYAGDLVANFAKQGGLADLSKYVQDATTLKKFLGPDVLEYGVFYGKQYAIPGKRQIVAMHGTWIRKDWLDKLGLPVPKTRDEWLTAVRAFKEKDPGNIGANLTPIGVGAPSYLDATLRLSFYEKNTERDRAQWLGDDLTIPGTKNALKFANMLHNEGLMQKDWALLPKNDMLNLQGAVSNGYVGTFTHNVGYQWLYNLTAAIDKNAPDCHWIAIDPFVNSEGKTPKNLYNPIGIYNMVPGKSKNADLVIKYLDWMADLQNLTKLMFGDKGYHYDLDTEGLIIPRKLSPDQVWESGNIADRGMILNGRPYDTIEKGIRAQTANWVSAKYPASVFIEHYRIADKDGIPPVRIVDLPESFVKMSGMLRDKAYEMCVKLTVAKPSEFDALYDQYTKEWLDMGARKVKEDLLKAYDAQVKK